MSLGKPRRVRHACGPFLSPIVRQCRVSRRVGAEAGKRWEVRVGRCQRDRYQISGLATRKKTVDNRATYYWIDRLPATSMLTSDQRGLFDTAVFCGGLLSENQKSRTCVRTTEIIITGKQSRSTFDKNTQLFYSQKIKINNTLLKFLTVRRNRTCSSLSREAVHLHREIVAKRRRGVGAPLSAPRAGDGVSSCRGEYYNGDSIIYFSCIFIFFCARKQSENQDRKKFAPTGNRTRVCTVAGYYSTTRPSVLFCLSSHSELILKSFTRWAIFGLISRQKTSVPRKIMSKCFSRQSLNRSATAAG